VVALPESSEAFQDATWDDLVPYFEELAARPLDRGNVESWMADWSQFESLLGEAASLAHTLSCKKRFKDAGLHFGRDARPVVGDLHKHILIFAHGTHEELTFFFHGIGGVVDKICPHLIQLAAVGHHLRQVGGKFADNHNAALQLVMHDDERRFQAVLDVHFLKRRLVHVGILFDRFDEIRNARGAVIEFGGDALHFEEGSEARELGAKRSSGGARKPFQLRVGQVCIGQKRRKFPGIGNASSLQPGLNRFFALDAGELIFVFSGFQRGTNFFFALSQQATIFRTQARTAASNAQAFQTIAKGGSGAAGCGGRVVQFVREARGELAKRSELLSLLLFPGDVPDAVGQKADETL